MFILSNNKTVNKFKFNSKSLKMTSFEAIEEQERLTEEIRMLCEQAKNFYSENGVPEKMEEILNSTFIEQPRDIYGHIANFFEAFMLPPIICDVNTEQIYDSRSLPILTMTTYCTYKNLPKKMATGTSIGTEFTTLDNKTPDAQGKLLDNRQREVDMARALIHEHMKAMLVNREPFHQVEFDEQLHELSEVMQKIHEEEMERKRIKEAEEAARIQAEEAEAAAKAEKEILAKGKKSPNKILSNVSRQKVDKEKTEKEDKKSKEDKEKKKESQVEVIDFKDEQDESLFFGSTAMTLASQVLCQTAAEVLDIPVYQYVSKLHFGKILDSYSLPLPIIPFLASGRLQPGKLNYIKEFCLFPSQSFPFQRIYQAMFRINAFLGHAVSSRQGLQQAGKPTEKVTGRYTNEHGVICPAMDKIEQGLDLLLEAINSLGLVAGVDFFMCIVCNPLECYDAERQRYEIMTGAPKTALELTEYWQDILVRYPSIIMIVDPMRREDREPWMKLCQHLSPRCYIIGDTVHHRPDKLLTETFGREWNTSGILLKYKGPTTLTTYFRAIRKMGNEEYNIVVVGTDCGENTEAFIVDLAIGIQARFVKLGGLVRGEKVAKYNRLVRIERDLSNRGIISTWPNDFVFPYVRPVTPPPPPEPIEEPPPPPPPPKSHKPTSGKKAKK